MGSASPLPYTYGLADIMRRLGQFHTVRAGRQIERTEKWQVAYAETLIGACDFPAPLPLPAGEGATRDVRPRSRWSRDPVDRWFEDQLPPGTAAADDRAAQRAAADDMDARAEKLGLRVMAGGRL